MKKIQISLTFKGFPTPKIRTDKKLIAPAILNLARHAQLEALRDKVLKVYQFLFMKTSVLKIKPTHV